MAPIGSTAGPGGAYGVNGPPWLAHPADATVASTSASAILDVVMVFRVAAAPAADQRAGPRNPAAPHAPAGYASDVSIIESLIKIVDPQVARQRELERKSAREQPKREVAGDPPAYSCRICGHEDTDGSYCPRCLADTMVRIKQHPAK